ncbi:hypothetical protein DLJ49_08330 [Rhodovulum sp. 12E13]|nr:hypothetical protein DLJ49_08330 [Rhodovulum sp. 12E13]
MAPQDKNTLSSFIWPIAELPRGDVNPSEYARVILPFVVLRVPSRMIT